MNETYPRPRSIEIGGTVYAVGALLRSEGRGPEWQCMRGDLVARVVRAPYNRYASVRTSGETVKFTWENRA